MWVKVTGTTGNEVTFSVKPIVAVGSPAVSTVKADLSSFGGSATQTLYDDATNGDATSGDGVFSYTHTFAPAAVTEEYKSVIFFATSTADRPVVPVKTGFFISPGDPTSLPLFGNADFESDPATAALNAAFTYEVTTGHDGNPTRALHFSGSLSGTGGTNSFTTADNCFSKSIGGFTKVTFWLRTDGATIPKMLNMEFGTLTSNIFAEQLFKLDSSFTNATTILQAGTTGTKVGFGYTYTSGNVPNTGGNWVKVTLDIANTDTVKQFMIRMANGVSYDFWLDDFRLEP